MKRTMILSIMFVVTLMTVMPTMSLANVDSDLLRAVQEGNSMEVRALLEKGADANATSKEDGWTALMLAAKGGHVEIVQELLSKGADVNATRDKNGWTGLVWALVDGEHKLVQGSLDGGSKSMWKTGVVKQL